MNFVDRVVKANRIGAWSVLAYAGQQKQIHFAWCLCDCGVVKRVNALNLLHGRTKNCGCVRKTTFNFSSHGMSKTPEYKAWKRMLTRASEKHTCSNPRNKQHYRDKGIRVCDEWVNSFEKFYEYIGPMPEGKCTLDRIDNAKGYELGNVRWASWTEQAQNTSRNHLVTINGETLCISEWARKLNIGMSTVKYRLNHGWTIEDALTAKPDLGNRWHRKNGKPVRAGMFSLN